MPAVANGLEHRGIAAKAVSIAPLGIACLEERFEVVEHQQTGPIPQELENHPEPLAFADGRHQLSVRQEVDGPRQPLAGGQSITHTAPVHAMECWRHVLGQLRGEHRLADATHAQYGCNLTVLSDQPVAQGRHLRGTTYKSEHIRCFAPVLASLRRPLCSDLRSGRVCMLRRSRAAS